MEIGFKGGRNLSKMVFLFSGIAISVFAMSGKILEILDFNMGLPVRNLIALSLLIPIFLLRGEGNILAVTKILFIKDKKITEFIYIIALVLVGISISTIQFNLLEQLLNIEILDFMLLAVRNFAAFGLLWAVKVIHFN